MPETPERILYKKLWYNKNRKRLIKKQSSYDSIRYKTNLEYRLKNILRARLRLVIKGKIKSGSAVKSLGCSIQEFKLYMESKFLYGMSWENYGQWHIDHIKPISSFNLSDEKEFNKACHYTNLQPLWASDNLKKSNK